MLKSLRIFVTGFLAGALLLGGTVGVLAAGDADIKAKLMATYKTKLFGKNFIPRMQKTKP